ncbi:hypothetical protein HPB47_016760, partial [Ixodes persulcatus]
TSRKRGTAAQKPTGTSARPKSRKPTERKSRTVLHPLKTATCRQCCWTSATSATMRRTCWSCGGKPWSPSGRRRSGRKPKSQTMKTTMFHCWCWKSCQSDLLETDLPIQEVQEKQQLKKGQKAPWYDRELTQQMRRKDRAYHKWKRHPCYDNWEAFKSLKREYNRMLKRKRAAFAQSSSDSATVAVAAFAVDERTKAGVPEEEQTAEGDVEAAAADSPEVAIVDAAESSCDSTTLPLESIPLPDFVSGDNYEPVEMEVDSDDATETPTLEVPDGSEDEDEAALREQLLQAVMRNRVTKAPTSERESTLGHRVG